MKSKRKVIEGYCTQYVVIRCVIKNSKDLLDDTAGTVIIK